jgi:SAM-dependent methyltransferase
MSNPTQRFNSRAQVYVAGRPSYPAAMIAWLQAHFPPATRVADIGAGTGILTKQLFDAGFSVTAVEPSAPMRNEIPSEILSLDGTAEAIPLPDASVELVTVVQAFHWFNQVAAMVEFNRILTPEGRVALIWNQRDDASKIGREYKVLVERHRGEPVPHVGPRATPNGFLGDLVSLRFDNPQILTKSALLSRVHSTSYLAQSPALDADFSDLFDRYAQDGILRLPQNTEMYVGIPQP